jgi:hypothetical protein
VMIEIPKNDRHFALFESAPLVMVTPMHDLLELDTKT